MLLSLFAAFSYAGFSNSLHRDFDRHLVHERRELMPFLLIEDGRPAFSGLEAVRSVAIQTVGHHGTYVRLLDPAGGVLYASPNLARHAPLAVELPGQPEEYRTTRDWDGAPIRSLITPVTSDDRLVGWMEVSGSVAPMRIELRQLLQTLVLGLLLSLALAVASGFWLARRALRPVAALTEAANDIRATDLGARLPAKFGPRDELTELAETFNQMIDRLEASVHRERRFTANAAHELLTPLATLRSEIEVALRREREPAAYREALAALLGDVDRMTVSVRGLLQLAHSDRLVEEPRALVDLSDVAARHAHRFRARAEQAGVMLEIGASGAVHVLASERRVGEVVDNLLDNSLKYSPAGSRVRLEVAADDGFARLAVTDSGAGFDPAHAHQLFDRFYRADVPAVQAQPGSGLGLAIVRAIVETYGGDVAATSEGPGRGSTFTVRLPLAPAGHGAAERRAQKNPDPAGGSGRGGGSAA